MAVVTNDTLLKYVTANVQHPETIEECIRTGSHIASIAGLALAALSTSGAPLLFCSLALSSAPLATAALVTVAIFSSGIFTFFVAHVAEDIWANHVSKSLFNAIQKGDEEQAIKFYNCARHNTFPCRISRYRQHIIDNKMEKFLLHITPYATDFRFAQSHALAKEGNFSDEFFRDLYEKVKQKYHIEPRDLDYMFQNNMDSLAASVLTENSHLIGFKAWDALGYESAFRDRSEETIKVMIEIVFSDKYKEEHPPAHVDSTKLEILKKLIEYNLDTQFFIEKIRRDSPDTLKIK